MRRVLTLVAAVSMALGLAATGPAVAGADNTDRTARQQATATMRPARPVRIGASRLGRKPNILLITTDDQAAHDLRFMPRTRRILGRGGFAFHGISPHPLCCPARAEWLTGQYAQNNGVRANEVSRYGGYERLRRSNTVATWLDRAGYNTVFMGKFLNGYHTAAAHHSRPGWDDWNGLIDGVYNYNRYTVNHNGDLRTHDEYQTDYFTSLARQKIRQYATQRRPFFLWQSYLAPHVQCEGLKRCRVPTASRHRRAFARARVPSFAKPSFNERDVRDKPREVRRSPRLGPVARSRQASFYRQRLGSLQAVDQGVAAMVRELRRAGELRRTLVIFNSDNGMLFGEHRTKGKILAYEESLRVPLLMRGPGVPRGDSRPIGTTIDVAPTLVHAAGARARLRMDGRSLLRVAQGRGRWDTLLVQAGPRTRREDRLGWLYRGVRTDRYTFVHWRSTDEVELYDRRTDPYQLASVHADRRYRPVRRELARRLAALRDCSGRQCRRRFGPVPAPRPVTRR